MIEPPILQQTGNAEVLGEIGRLDNEGVGAQIVGQPHITNVFPGGEHDDHDPAQSGLGANPLQHLSTGPARQF